MYDEIIIISVLISIIFSEFTGLSPAGIIVPGYIALSLKTPERIFLTLAVVLLTLGATRIISNFTIIFGKRKFAVMIVLSFLISSAISFLSPVNINVIGCIIPGIMANECDKQGILKSLASVSIVVSLVALVMMWQNIAVF